ncbi:MAG: hypothetical protein BWY72_01696 [Bacteroidetes bacterium ADurb.Bin416]|nr:MAG: hypothetical protein BWY72_01696 [Bacteroidetes bacterium ADurb.Bin416]
MNGVIGDTCGAIGYIKTIGFRGLIGLRGTVGQVGNAVAINLVRSCACHINTKDSLGIAGGCP